MAAKAHAILSASSSDRWLHCPPSARLCETYEDKGSDYAAEGTDAHALGEHKLKTVLGLPSEDPTDNLKWYSEEMEDCTSGYAEYVLEQLFARLRELDPEADTIIQLWKDHPEGISDRAIARELGRPQKTFADQMKKYRTDLRRITGEK